MEHRSILGFFLSGAVALAACGDDETQPAGGSGGSGAEGSASGGGGDGGGAALQPSIAAVHAPDEFTVVIEFEGTLEEAPAENAWTFTAPVGDLPVVSATYDAATKTVTVRTARQKLGSEYTLLVMAPGNPLDLQSKRFLSADTATFWTSDFDDFSYFEVVAERLGVGENIVVYASPEGYADDYEAAIAYFDERIVPIESSLLHEVPDRDGNGKVVVLGLDGEGYYGGYFSPIDSLSDDQAQEFGYHSNEMEMLYISTPDLGGSFGAVEVIAHEFSHLLYNEQHDFLKERDWPYHNEGLAECAVAAVAGVNQVAQDYYLYAPGLVDGQSLVRWIYSNYDQYVQAYVFWTYAAAQLGGVQAYGDMFDLSGDPTAIDAYFVNKLGKSMADVQLDMLAAAWIQAPSGRYSFEGMIEFNDAINGGQPQVATGAPRELETFTGVFFTGPGAAITPTGSGTDVLVIGINGAGVVSTTAPLDASGGVVIALNALHDPDTDLTQSSGAFPSTLRARRTAAAPPSRLWMHPPPLNPMNMEAVRSWRLHAHGF